MSKASSVSSSSIWAAVAAALLALPAGCLPEVPDATGNDDAVKERPRTIDGKAGAPPPSVNVSTDAAGDPANVPPADTSPVAPVPPLPSPPEPPATDAAPADRAATATDAGATERAPAIPDAAPAERMPVAVDAGAPTVDATAPTVDAAAPVVDAAAPPVDLGAPVVDAAAPPVDLGVPVVDAATPMGDAAAPMVDAALPEAALPCPCQLDAAPPPVSRAPLPGEIVIAELLVNPAGTDTGREWIELRNLANVPLSLAELHVADRLSDVAVAAGVLASGEVLLLGQSLDPSKNGGAPVAVGYGPNVSLNNDGDTISLCWGACATGLVLDRYTYGTLGAAYDGHALIVPTSPLTDPARKGCPAQDPFGTADSYGTPGRANPPCMP